MITLNSYYRGEIYIPQAKPSITDEALVNEDDFAFIKNKYEEDCLVKCLGHSLYESFIANIDGDKENFLKDEADEKWDRLLNGYSYIKPNETKTVKWKGIRYKTPFNNDVYNTSFLAYYVYFFYERKQYLTTTSLGTGKPEIENMVKNVPTQKVVEAWNTFVKHVQGETVNRVEVFNSQGLYGVDYYKGDNHVCLYDFINDMNNIQTDYYSDFQPTVFELMNKFGI